MAIGILHIAEVKIMVPVIFYQDMHLNGTQISGERVAIVVPPRSE